MRILCSVPDRLPNRAGIRYEHSKNPGFRQKYVGVASRLKTLSLSLCLLHGQLRLHATTATATETPERLNRQKYWPKDIRALSSRKMLSGCQRPLAFEVKWRLLSCSLLLGLLAVCFAPFGSSESHQGLTLYSSATVTCGSRCSTRI